MVPISYRRSKTQLWLKKKKVLQKITFPFSALIKFINCEFHFILFYFILFYFIIIIFIIYLNLITSGKT